MIQSALEVCFNSINDQKDKDKDLEEFILKITKSILQDPTKYLTFDFMVFLINRLMDSGREIEAENILLDPKISVNIFPELWTYYIDK